MVNLPHSPATISTNNLIRARQTDKPVEDIITARVVGFNHKAKEVLAQDGGGNTYSVSASAGTAVSEGQSVILSRSRSQSGERTIRYISTMTMGNRPSDIFGQPPNQGNTNDLCEPTSLGDPTGGTSVPTNPPGSPSGPGSQNRPTRTPDPDEPDPDPPSEPEGCRPNDNTQWYNGTECPAGMVSLGFADMPDGSSKVLCRSPSGDAPPGDGCPVTPDQYGWSCSSTGCVFVANGSFVTQEECEAACTEPEPEDESEDPPLPDEPIDPEEPDPSVTSTLSFTYTTDSYTSDCVLLKNQNNGIDYGGGQTFTGTITTVTASLGGTSGSCGGLRTITTVDNFGRIVDQRSYTQGHKSVAVSDLVITYS